MTTIAWTRGCFASDSCITHADDNAMPGHRTFARKLKVFGLKPNRSSSIRSIALASKGVATVAAALDALVARQAIGILETRSKIPLVAAMNRPALLKKRQDLLKDNDVAQLITCWAEEDETCYLMENNGILQLVEEPYIAIGWDSAAAFGSLRAGQNALFAVESATMYGCYSAKPIHYLERGPSGLELKILV